MDPSSRQLSLAERRRQWAEEPKGLWGHRGQPGAGLLQARRPDPLGGSHMSLKEGNSGQAAEQGTQHHTLPGGSRPCTSHCGSASLPRFSHRPSGDNPPFHQFQATGPRPPFQHLGLG